MKDLYQTADWKSEKHVPVIELPDQVAKDEPIQVTVSVGKEIAHPNTTAHFIEWMELYFKPSGEKFPVMLGRYQFSAHGASAKGADSSTIYAEPHIGCVFKTGKPGVLHAASYCNIHGLWTSEVELNV